MTIENAITALADAMLKAAEINAAASDRLAAAYGASMGAYTAAAGEPEKATDKLPTNAKDAVAAAKAAATKADAEKKAKAEADAKVKEQEEADLVGGGAAVELDYDKDVAPVLTALLAKNRQGLVELLKQFGAKNGAGLKKADYPAVLVEAAKL